MSLGIGCPELRDDGGDVGGDRAGLARAIPRRRDARGRVAVDPVAARLRRDRRAGRVRDDAAQHRDEVRVAQAGGDHADVSPSGPTRGGAQRGGGVGDLRPGLLGDAAARVGVRGAVEHVRRRRPTVGDVDHGDAELDLEVVGVCRPRVLADRDVAVGSGATDVPGGDGVAEGDHAVDRWAPAGRRRHLRRRRRHHHHHHRVAAGEAEAGAAGRTAGGEAGTPAVGGTAG